MYSTDSSVRVKGKWDIQHQLQVYVSNSKQIRSLQTQRPSILIPQNLISSITSISRIPNIPSIPNSASSPYLSEASSPV